MTKSELNQRALRLLARMKELGITKGEKPVVLDHAYELVAADEGLRNQHVLRKQLAPTLALIPDHPEECDGTDFIMKEDVRGVWVKVGNFSVHLCRGSLPGQPAPDGGLRVYVYAGSDIDEALDSLQFAAEDGAPATPSTVLPEAGAEDDQDFSDLEDTADRLGIDLDDVRFWVGLHYGRDLDKESAEKQEEWLHRYREMNGLTPEYFPESAEPLQPISIEALRNLADAAFEGYAFDLPVAAHNGWEWSTLGQVISATKVVFLENPTGGDTLRQVFSLEINKGSVTSISVN